MATQIIKQHVNYTIEHTGENIKCFGSMTFSEKIDNLNLTVYNLEDEHQGEIHYSEDGVGNVNYNMNIKGQYRDEAYMMFVGIINEASAAVLAE